MSGSSKNILSKLRNVSIVETKSVSKPHEMEENKKTNHTVFRETLNTGT
jgi:hypothetical protein